MLPFTDRLKWGGRTALIAVLLNVLPGTASAGFYFVEEARPILIKADTDQDGYLSKREIGAEEPALLPAFDQADVNRDGKLDLGEFEILLISL